MSGVNPVSVCLCVNPVSVCLCVNPVSVCLSVDPASVCLSEVNPVSVCLSVNPVSVCLSVDPASVCLSVDPASVCLFVCLLTLCPCVQAYQGELSVRTPPPLEAALRHRQVRRRPEAGAAGLSGPAAAAGDL